MQTVQKVIEDRLSDLWSEVTTIAAAAVGNIDKHPTSTDIHDAFTAAIDDLTDAFGWHPIERADDFDLRVVPPGKKWGPRVIVLVQGFNAKTPTPHVAYYDPDTDAAHPAPYWRTVGMTAGWSRRNQPTHFIRTYG